MATKKTASTAKIEAEKEVDLLAEVTETKDLIVVDKQLPTIVIPFLASQAKGLELLYALRCIEKNIGECPIIIIGDKPDFVSNKVQCIAHTPESENPQIDCVHKIMMAIASDLVPEEFVWLNDDIFVVNPTLAQELHVLNANGLLEETKQSVTGVYKENKDTTLAILQELGASTFDYDTHTPMVFQKNVLASIIKKSKANEIGLLLASLYYNLVYAGFTPFILDGGVADILSANVYRPNPNAEVLQKAFESRRYINVNDAGYDAVLPLLEAKFANKSVYEK